MGVDATSDSVESFEDVLSVHGQTVEFSRTRSAVRVVVDWHLKPSELDKAGLNFRERNFVAVEFLKSAMTPPPDAGQFFRVDPDEGGETFDVQAVTRTDLTYRCYCSVGEPVAQQVPEYNQDTGEREINVDTGEEEVTVIV